MSRLARSLGPGSWLALGALAIGLTKRKFYEGFGSCISEYFGSGKLLRTLDKSNAKKYILGSGTYRDVYLLEQRLIAKYITSSCNLNLGLDTLAASDAVLQGLTLEEDAQERLERIARYYSAKEENELLFSEKVSKLRNDKQLRIELLQLRSIGGF